MKNELSEITVNFLNSRIYKEFPLPDEIFEAISQKAEYLCYMRAIAQADQGGELIGEVYPEKPTRILKQWIKYYYALKSLDDNYSDEKALRIIGKIVDSSASPVRLKVFTYLFEEKNQEIEHTLSQVADFLKIGKKTAYRELNILWNMCLLERRTEEIMAGYQRDIPTGREKYYYSLNLNHEFIQELKQSFYNPQSPKEAVQDRRLKWK